MKNVFRDINARSDAEYKYVKENPAYQDFLTGFYDYQTDLSFKAGKVNKSSNKAKSYHNHLIKLIIFYKDIYGAYPTRLDSPKTSDALNAFFDIPEFVKFNQEKHNFFSATIHGYLNYLDQLAIKNANQVNDEDGKSNYKIELLREPQKRLAGVSNRTIEYPRSQRELMAAKHKADWKCSYDKKHITFISEKEHKSYVEGHHLIPMQYQAQFEYTIDFADNIVPLCPNCHRRIHYSIKQDRNKMIEQFYFNRIDDIRVHGIDISIDQLEKWYA
ncbi:HNH endonuclease [Ligilactobacillus equi]|uniref:HNH endonuclease n=1 Tax=Ligilactobacillus equi TaxID=137357 RepID=UPI002ED4F77B